MDDKLFAPKKDDFPQGIENAEKFGIIEQKGNKKIGKLYGYKIYLRQN